MYVVLTHGRSFHTPSGPKLLLCFFVTAIFLCVSCRNMSKTYGWMACDFEDVFLQKQITLN